MPLFFYKEKRSLKLISCICMMIVSYSCPAQNNNRLPDSLRVDDTVSLEKRNDVETITSTTDSGTNNSSRDEDSVIFRTVPDSVVAAYKRDKDFQYANQSVYWSHKPEERKDNFQDRIFKWVETRWFRMFLLFLLVSVLIFALYKIIAENKMYMFYSAPKKTTDENANEVDMTYDSIEDKIQDAINSGDFRMALRFMYLKALKKAGDKGFIHFHAQGTNQEYIRQMAAHPGEMDFRFLTYAYEHVWYGGFSLTPQQFQLLKTQFTNLYNTLDS
jgi:hypothetical protein